MSVVKAIKRLLKGKKRNKNVTAKPEHERETATATKKVIKGKRSEHGKIEKAVI
jgi:hypothetical protein